MYVQWTEECRVDVPAFDEQHRRLLDLLNDIMIIVNEPGTHHGGDFYSVHGDFAELMNRHFSEEEEALKQNGFPHLDQHQQEHRELQSTLAELLTCYEASNRAHTVPLTDYFKKWFVIHIKLADQRYREFLTNNGTSRKNIHSA